MKKIIGMVVAMVVSATVANAGYYTWSSYDELGSNDPGFDLASVTGQGAAIGDYIAIYRADVARDAGTTWYNDVRFDNAGLELTFNDTLAFSATVEDDGGWLWVNQSGVDLSLGEYYSVVFDNALVADATSFVVLQTATFEVTVSDNLPAGTFSTFDSAIDADLGSVQWQVIPEPATLGLMGVAGLGMFLARKKARR